MQKGIVAPLHEKSVIGSVSHFTKILKRPNFISPFIYKIHVRFYAKRDTRSALFRAMRVSLIFFLSGCSFGLAQRSQLHIHPGRDAGRPCTFLAQLAELLTDMVRALAVLKRDGAIFYL